MSSTATPSACTELGRGYVQQAQELRATARWLAGSAGLTSAAVVAGLQLTSVAGADALAALAAVVGVVVSLVALGAALVAVSRVLAADRPTVSEISNQEMAAGLFPEGGAPQSSPDEKHALVYWIQERRTSLLGDAGTVTALYSDGVVGAGNALRDLGAGRNASYAGRQLTPGDQAAKDWIASVHQAALARVAAVEDAAAFWKTQKEYRQLLTKRWFLWLFVLGILLFALAPSLSTQAPRPAIQEPIDVTVFLDGTHHGDLPTGCESVIEGQAVGGLLSEPLVVAPASGKCPALRLQTSDQDVVIYEEGGTTALDDGSSPYRYRV